MEKEAIKNIFDFLQKKENKKHKNRDNFIWKLNFGEPLTKEDLIVDGDLDLFYCEKISSLPEGLKVVGSLKLQYTKIASLPEQLYVGKHLSLRNTNITSLPKGLKVFGGLLIQNTPLTNYTDEHLREMVKPGYISRILR